MAQKYFKSLNYSMANEDSFMEREIVKKLGCSSLLSVCGSGARALCLLNPEVDKLDCVDLSAPQLSLAKLRLALIKRLSFEDYLKFWGYPPYSPQEHKEFRQKAFEQLELSSEDREMFLELHQAHNWEALLYSGKWESSFAAFGKAARVLLGRKGLDFFQFSDLSEQQAYLEKGFPWKRWNLLVKVIGNKAVFNALLYKGDFIKKNINEKYFDYYSGAFDRLFKRDLAKNNFFLQLCFLGAIRFPEGNIPEATADCFEDMKNLSRKTRIEFYQDNIVELAKNKAGYDYISISDVPSYFSGYLEKNFLQIMRGCLAPGGSIVIRSYLRIPEADRSGFKDISERFRQEIASEKTQMYRVEVLQKI